MRQPKYILSANDNAPQRVERARFGKRLAKTDVKPTSSDGISKYKQPSDFGWIIPLLACAMTISAVWQGSSFLTLFWPTMIITVLLFWTALRAAPFSRLRNISSLMFVGAAALCMYQLLSQNGFTLIAVEIALVVSSIALVSGWVLRSRPAIMLSSIGAIGYLMSLFPELGLLTGFTDGLSKLGIGLVPCLLFGQAIAAQKFRSYALSLTVIIASYVWMIAIAKNMIMPELIGLGFAISAAHYCLGKAWCDQGLFGARLHTVFPLIIALGTALYMQSLWMNIDTGQAKPLSSPNRFWWSIFGVATFVIFISSLMRYKASQISLSGIFIISTAALVLPIATVSPDIIYAAFENIPGLEAHPGLGLVIGAAIIACGVTWVANGLKQGRLLNVIIGAVAIGVEGLILYQPSRFNMDLAVIFIVSLICALCIGGLIAGSTFDESRHTPNHA